MLAEAAARTPAETAGRARWVLGRGEDLAQLDIGPIRATTLGQSFHWMDSELVATAVFDLLEPGGAMLLIHHEVPSFGPGDDPPAGSPHPPIPHEVVDEVLVRYLGSGKPPPDLGREPYSDLLARTPFGRPEHLVLPGRTDLVRTIDEVIDNYLSTSFAAPDLFGDQLDDFRAALAADLARQTPTGCFWEWPGDTDVLIARKLV